MENGSAEGRQDMGKLMVAIFFAVIAIVILLYMVFLEFIRDLSEDSDIAIIIGCVILIILIIIVTALAILDKVKYIAERKFFWGVWSCCAILVVPIIVRHSSGYEMYSKLGLVVIGLLAGIQILVTDPICKCLLPEEIRIVDEFDMAETSASTQPFNAESRNLSAADIHIRPDARLSTLPPTYAEAIQNQLFAISSSRSYNSNEVF